MGTATIEAQDETRAHKPRRRRPRGYWLRWPVAVFAILFAALSPTRVVRDVTIERAVLEEDGRALVVEFGGSDPRTWKGDACWNGYTAVVDEYDDRVDVRVQTQETLIRLPLFGCVDWAVARSLRVPLSRELGDRAVHLGDGRMEFPLDPRRAARWPGHHEESFKVHPQGYGVVSYLPTRSTSALFRDAVFVFTGRGTPAHPGAAPPGDSRPVTVRGLPGWTETTTGNQIFVRWEEAGVTVAVSGTATPGNEATAAEELLRIAEEVEVPAPR